MPESILIIARSDAFGVSISRMVGELGRVQVRPLAGGVDALADLPEPDVAIMDFGSGARTTTAFVRAFPERMPSCSVLAVVDPDGAATAVDLMDEGVDDYILGIPRKADLLARCRRLVESHDLRKRLSLLQAELNRRYGAHRIVCRSSAMEAVYQRVLQLAPTSTTVFISGESGSGKELVARSLHYNSPRRDGPFIAVNCGAVPETLIESELFGHQRGAFTGAVETVPGKFELAKGGTLFLDEVGSMGLSTQVRLLRVLEGGEFMRVGGRTALRFDARVVAATNTELEEQVATGEFRADLMYRLKVATIEVPPLRRRRDDIPPLARTFVKQLCEEQGLPAKELAAETSSILAQQDWPGNVRELKNLLESLVVTIEGPLLLPEHLPGKFQWSDAPSRANSPAGHSLPDSGITLAELERRYIKETLQALAGNRTQAAKSLGIGIRTLQRKIKLYGIDVPPVPPS